MNTTENIISSDCKDHISNRRRIVQKLRREMVGPCCVGRPVDCSGEIVCEDRESFYGPSVQAGSNNEIIKGESPRKRYGVGVLYPAGILREPEEDPDESGSVEYRQEVANGVSTVCLKELEREIEKVSGASVQKETDDFDISMANLSRPRSMGISFLAEIPRVGSVIVRAKGGRYRAREVRLRDTARPATWWLRSSVSIEVVFHAENILSKRGLVEPDEIRLGRNCDGLDIRIELFSRDDPSESGISNRRLLTVCLVNRTADHLGDSLKLDERCLFQSRFRVWVITPNNRPCILPYPEAGIIEPDEEEQSLQLLYRKAQTYAAGHGCAADWSVHEGMNRAYAVRAVPFPVLETPSITPEIHRHDGTSLLIPMTPLAGLGDQDDGMASLEEIVNLYGRWISEKEREAADLEDQYKPAADSHIKLCRRCHARMIDGLRYLREDSDAALAFKLANKAILLQQIRSFRASRVMEMDEETKRLSFKKAFDVPDPNNPSEGRGRWRPFQIAFLLMVLRSTVEDQAADPVDDALNNKDTVELLWFPTGGGKTEAYLGLTAFALFMRRLSNKEDAGTHVLMRYTLRLLTAQQFQRAAALICAMESIRREKEALLGSQEFSIGIWLGGETTPNTRSDARSKYRDLMQRPFDAEYPFVILRCPWCGAQIGPCQIRSGIRQKGKGLKKRLSETLVLGVTQRDDTIILYCPDDTCLFHRKLPVQVIDEDIYEIPSSLLIGTVDKFANLAWKPEARSLFGIGPDGHRVHSPPGLIIQDELHLITGPLGSIAGLYETVIEELCTDYSEPSNPVRPKVISSTATIRRYREQIKGLYARSDTALFPPPGLDASDSFFALYARNNDGSLKRGRQYVGIHATNLSSLLTTQVRVYSSLLQSGKNLGDDERDPWWTLMIFFNSLRELGGGLTLFQSDIPERIYEISKRLGLSERRFLNNVRELTGRISSSEVPAALQELEKRPGQGEFAVDACLASNIIEVGIDVDRLSLMCVAGQPKTTSQYIQVTGRVGRRWWERPGLIVTIYNPLKPRDRSHFEKFRTYHERLYAQVEPSCVTPFTPPALKRALHAVIAAYIRQTGTQEQADNPSPYPEDQVQRIREILEKRVRFVDVQERNNLINELQNRISEWKVWNHDKWQAGPTQTPSLLRYTGTYYPEIWHYKSWATPTSMRSVDVECRPEITQLYLRENIEAMGKSEE